MIITDVLDEAPGLFQQFCLRVLYADGGVNIPEPPVYFKQPLYPGELSVNNGVEGLGAKIRQRWAMTHRLVVPVTFFPELRAEQTMAILLFLKLTLRLS